MRIPAGLYEGFYMSITTVALLHGGQPPREGGLQRGEVERASYSYSAITRRIVPLVTRDRDMPSGGVCGFGWCRGQDAGGKGGRGVMDQPGGGECARLRSSRVLRGFL